VALADASRLERDLTFEGVILFSDPPKPDVGKAISALAAQGIASRSSPATTTSWRATWPASSVSRSMAS